MGGVFHEPNENSKSDDMLDFDVQLLNQCSIVIETYDLFRIIEQCCNDHVTWRYRVTRAP
jgi:hypothetical protein